MGELGDMIRIFRESKGLSRKEFCKMADISTSGLAYYEKGGRKPSGKVLHKIRKTFNLPDSYFTTQVITPREKEDAIMEVKHEAKLKEKDMLIDRQNDIIKYQKQEIEQLKINAYALTDTMFESDLPTFESWNEIKLFPFQHKNIDISDNFMSLNTYLRCPEEKFIYAFKGDGKFYKWEDAPIQLLLSNNTKKTFAKTMRDLPVIVRNVKHLIAKHHWEETVTYQWKENKITTYVRTKIDFNQSPILTHSKCTIINGDA